MPARMTIAITADVSGSRRKLPRILEVLSKTKVLTAVGEAQSLWVMNNIRGAGAPSGSMWQTMAAQTLRRRPNRASARHFSSRFQARLIAGVKATKHFAATAVTVSIKEKHAPIQHFGGANQDGRSIPPRPMLPSTVTLRRVTQTALDDILRQIRAAAK